MKRIIMSLLFRLRLRLLTVLGAHYHMYGDNPKKEPEMIHKPCFRHLLPGKHDKGSSYSRYNKEIFPKNVYEPYRHEQRG